MLLGVVQFRIVVFLSRISVNISIFRLARYWALVLTVPALAVGATVSGSQTSTVSVRERHWESVIQLDCAIERLESAIAGLNETREAFMPAAPKPQDEAHSRPPSVDERALPLERPVETEPTRAVQMLPARRPQISSWTHRAAAASGSIIGRGLLSAAWAERLHRPREWETGPEGFGWRLASSVGRSVVSRSIQFAVARVDGEKNRSCRPQGGTPLGRLGGAMAGSLTAGDAGQRSIAWSRIAAAFGGAAVATIWNPPSRRSLFYVAQSGANSLVLRSALSVVREFGPSWGRKQADCQQD